MDPKHEAVFARDERDEAVAQLRLLKERVAKRLHTVKVANSRGNKQHVVEYMLTELIDELS